MEILKSYMQRGKENEIGIYHMPELRGKAASYTERKTVDLRLLQGQDDFIADLRELLEE